MRKNLFILGLSTLALTGCTSVIDEEPIQSNAIGFQNSIGRPSRSVVIGDLTADEFDEFYVYGYYTAENSVRNPVQVFDGTKVTRDLKNPNSSWSYTNKRYWIPDATYYFFAYSCADIELKNDYGTLSLDLVNDPSRVMKVTNYICDNYHNHDLVYAKSEPYVGKKPGEDGSYANKLVNLEFKHILTKVSATFTSDFDPSYDIVVSDVKIINVRNKGSFDPLSSGEYKWAAEREKKHIVAPQTQTMVNLPIDVNKNIANKGTRTVSTGAAFVIPWNYSEGDVQLQFSIEVLDKNSGERVLERDLTGSWSPNWKLGYYYTYNINITGSAANLEEIRFGDMNVNDWGGTTSDVVINFSAN